LEIHNSFEGGCSVNSDWLSVQLVCSK